jgi:3-dehydroquinate dehydratase-2
MKLIVINGPNLNLLGTRETDIYGKQSFESYFETLKNKFPEHQLTYFQSNVEGELINKIQEAGKTMEGIVLNAGGYTHSSVAIADAVAAIQIPTLEVHISNIFAREDFRHVSYLGRYCKGSISGFGLKGYEMAISWFGNKENT